MIGTFLNSFRKFSFCIYKLDGIEMEMLEAKPFTSKMERRRYWVMVQARDNEVLSKCQWECIGRNGRKKISGEELSRLGNWIWKKKQEDGQNF